MSEQAERRFEVVVEEGVPHGDLYELEQTTYYHVVDRQSGKTVLTFEGSLEASLSTDTGLWDGYCLSGVREVSLATDERSVVVSYHDGTEETIQIGENHMKRDDLLQD
jgi:hypothetical protein